jgi:hypothetical protein
VLRVVSDVNVEGHVRDLFALIRRSEWCEIWDALEVELCTFSDLGLSNDADDRTIW